MKIDEFERNTTLTVIAHDQEGSSTEASLEFARLRLGDLWSKPDHIYLLYQDDPWEFVTYVVDAHGKAIRFSGFAWGYGGTGPHGLIKMIEEMGWTPPVLGTLPPAHTPGVWMLTPEGNVFEL